MQNNLWKKVHTKFIAFTALLCLAFIFCEYGVFILDVW